MELDLSEIPDDKQAEVRKQTESIYEDIVFRGRGNPIKKIVFTKDLEKRLQSFLSSDREKRERSRKNEVKSVETIGKILTIIKNKEIHFVLLFNCIVLGSAELFHDTLFHEGVHVIDYEWYFKKVGKGPFQELPRISKNNYDNEFFVWSEYHASRVAAMFLKTFNLPCLSIHNTLVDSLENLLEKLREAKKLGRSGEQESADYVVQVAMSDLLHLYIGAIAKSEEYHKIGSEELRRLFEHRLFERILGSTLVGVRRILEEVFSDKNKPVFEFFPRLREKLELMGQSLNHFRLHAEY